MNKDVKNELICDHCKDLFKSRPIKLPCDYTICSQHISSLKTGRNSIKCPFCYFTNTFFSTVHPRHKLIEIESDKELFKQLLVHHFNSCQNSIETKIDNWLKSLETEIDSFYENLNTDIEDNKKKKINQIKLNYVEKWMNILKQTEDNFYIDSSILDTNSMEQVKNILEKFELQLESDDFELTDDYDQKIKYFEWEITKLINLRLKQFLDPIQYLYLTSIPYHDNYNSVFGELKSIENLSEKMILIDKDGLVNFFSISTNSFLGFIKGKINNFKLMKFLKNGYLVCIFDDCLKIWDLKSSRRVKILREDTTNFDIKNLIITPEEDHIIYSCNKKIRIFKFSNESLKLVGVFEPKLKKSEYIQCLKYRNKYEIVLSYDNIIEIWTYLDDIKLKNKIEQKNKHITCLEFLDQNRVITGSTFGYINVFDLRNKQSLKSHKINYNEGFGMFKKIIVLKNNKILTHVSDLVSILDINLNSLFQIDQVKGPFKLFNNNHLAFSNNNKKFSIQIWNIDEKKFVKEIENLHEINCIQTIPSKENFLVTSCVDRSIKIWSLNDSCCIKNINLKKDIKYFKFY